MSTEETKPVVAATEPETTAIVADAAVEPLAPTTGTDVEAAKPEATEGAAVEEPAATEAVAAVPAEEPVVEKAVEPITEGQLAYKGPGLVKSLIPSKKEFWLSDEAVTPEHMDLFTRGEKPEIAHPIVAWASQTGKGLLFVNKKNVTDRTHPADVLALYDATELKKQAPHEFSFKLNGHNHTFKAANDTERDGWYMSIEKAVELGKASKEEILGSEGYKAEHEKLTKPIVPVVAAARSASKPKKSVEVPATERVGSEDAVEAAEDKDAKKTQKSRSTSRGMLARFNRKKDEVVEKKEEKEADKEEAKAEEVTPVTDATEAAPIATAVAAAEIPAAAEAAAAEKPVEETPAVVEEKPKPNKRASIFGKFSMKSPSKEKDAKEAELKAEAPKDAVVSENPPQIPETTTEPAVETAVPAVEEPATETTEAPKEAEVASPSKEKSNFLSGLGGFMKRGRSVSPSTAMKEAPKKEETAAPAVEEPVVVAAEPTKVEEPATEAGAVAEPVATEEATEEEKKDITPNKRQSVLGSLGRRASKAFKGMQAPKKENAAPAATEASKEEATEVKAAEETPVVNGETSEIKTEDAQKSIGDVVPDAVNVGQPQPVAASA